MKNTLLTTFAIAIVFAYGAAHPNNGFGYQRTKIIDELNLTETQKEHFDKVRYETQKKQIELRAKIATARLELQKLMSADSPDKSAVEKKLNEIASLKATMKMNRFNAWLETNKALTPEQQKVWKKTLTEAPQRLRDMRHERSDDCIRKYRQW